MTEQVLQLNLCRPNHGQSKFVSRQCYQKSWQEVAQKVDTRKNGLKSAFSKKNTIFLLELSVNLIFNGCLVDLK